MIANLKYTHADLLTMPDDGKRREILDGDLYVTPSPVTDHQRILGNLAYAIWKFLDAHPLGKLFVAPLDVILSEYDVLEPDLLFLLNEHLNMLQDWVRGAPDLVIEILSLATELRDRGIKLKTYARYGVGEYWIVDPKAQVVEVYRLAPSGYQMAAKFAKGDVVETVLLPGLSLPVRAIFRS